MSDVGTFSEKSHWFITMFPWAGKVIWREDGTATDVSVKNQRQQHKCRKFVYTSDRFRPATHNQCEPAFCALRSVWYAHLNIVVSFDRAYEHMTTSKHCKLFDHSKVNDRTRTIYTQTSFCLNMLAYKLFKIVFSQNI